MQDDLEPISQLLTETIAGGQTIQLLAPTSSAIYLKAQILRTQGSLQQALQFCQEGLEFVTRRGRQVFPRAGYLYAAYGNILLLAAALGGLRASAALDHSRGLSESQSFRAAA